MIKFIIRPARLKYLLLLIFIIVTAPNNYSQWTWQNPLPQGNDLRGIIMLNNYKALAIGINGTLIKSTNGGNNWIVSNISTNYHLTGIAFADSMHGMVSGLANSTGIILRTTDGGNNWIETSSPVSSNLNGISYINKNMAVAVGDNGTILKTIDGGNTWLGIISNTTNALISVSFYDELNGVAVGREIVLRTSDGGDNWLICTTPILTDYQLNGIIYKDLSHVIAVGDDGIIIKSIDGGINWSLQNSQTTSHLYSVSFTDSLNGTAAGGFSPWDGIIIHTSDGGNTWYVQFKDELQSNIFSLSFTDSNHGIAVGGYGIIYKTEDGGNNWLIKSQTISDEFLGVSFFGPQLGIVVGTGLFKTTNGGSSWINLDTIGKFTGLNGVKMIDSLNVTAVGIYGTIIRTSDGGKNWVNQISGTTKILKKVCFTDINNGIICGAGGNILKTTDGGKNWKSISFNTNTDYYGLSFTDTLTGIVVGGHIAKTTNGGNNWTIQKTGDFNNVFFIDKNIGWVIGQSGVILKTTDGGSSWANQISGTNLPLYGLGFYDKNNGWIIGGAGVMLHPTNGGGDGIKQTNILSFLLWDICLSDNKSGTIVGDGGAILHTTNSGISFIKNEPDNLTPNEFYLYQNYPNPFNLTTIIKIKLLFGMNISLVVYDLIGRKIKIIFEGFKEPGEYKYEFSGNNLSSGVYFYQLKTKYGAKNNKLLMVK